ncbi:MAG TPA: transposase [Opitutaceae bacterium]|nr:transposase [Opitutaceae bacterium]
MRLESEEGVYHVLNRGNYRADIFRGDKTKAAFLKCLDEACARTGWRVHAWCIMSNHYHLAVSTPRANLVEGMTWLQGTFATRFNRMRDERGHLFQGRYKSLIVDPDGGLGPLCHYIHLNPVRARLCVAGELPKQRWTSTSWLFDPAKRASWYDPLPALEHAGGLADTTAGRRKYLEYLAWLAEDEPARKAQQFEKMSKGWVIGSKSFTKEIVKENRELAGHGRRLAAELREAREEGWREELTALLRKLRRKPAEMAGAGKSEDWKLAIASEMKTRTTVTNRWLATQMHMGNMYEVSRKVVAWSRHPDPSLLRHLR